MKSVTIVFFFAAWAASAIAQKPALDESTYDHWAAVRQIAVSNDGRFSAYTVSGDYKSNLSTLVLQSNDGNWKMELEGPTGVSITQDSRTAIFMQGKDSLCLLRLGGSSADHIPGVASFQLVQRGHDEWLTYRLRSPAGRWMARNLSTGKEIVFDGVTGISFSNDGRILLLQTVSNQGGRDMEAIRWMDFPEGSPVTIWQGEKASGFVFDDHDRQLAFMADETVNGGAGRSIWYYKTGMDKAILLADGRSPGVDSVLKISGVTAFSKDGSRVFMTLKEKDYEVPPPNALLLDVWSYRDPRLQSEQLRELKPFPPGYGDGGGPRTYRAVIPVDEHRVIRLQETNEIMYRIDGSNEEVALASYFTGNQEEWNWNRTSQPITYLVSTRTGQRKRLNLGDSVRWPTLSPTGKYVFFYDGLRRNMLVYDVSAGSICNLTRDLPVPMIDSEEDDNALPRSRGLLLAQWLAGDRALLIYDRFDIWQVDPTGKEPPIAVTNGYGRKHNLVFRLASHDYAGKAIGGSDTLLLSAMDRRTKDGGFYVKVLGTQGDPQRLSMGPYRYELPYLRSSSSPLPKIGNEDLYLVKRESAKESPNYFLTRDFRSFRALTHVYPESEYNWLTTQLLSWRSPDGHLLQGILYKPENFDPSKKYPVIFHYYEKLSDNLNKYIRPEPISNNLEIPWFVSHGYLVFTPDIFYTIGYPGRSACNALVSAAKLLSSFPWVDARRMGIQGHSWGGFETNYIVTHTHLFAAAMSSSGISDCISEYGSITPEHERGGKAWFYEHHQSRIGPTPWQRPDLYLENSAVLKADRVTTPLLMMNNKEDGIVPWAQGVEFFVALRRLGKTAWMLQYDGQAHSLDDEKVEKQHTKRITQFFDYYLKGAPPGKWMTQGIPAKLKGIDDGLEPDTTGETPGPGLLSGPQSTGSAN